MRKGWSIGVSLVLLAVLLITWGCTGSPPGPSGFNMIFRYGVGARNELDTFQGTYTRDMVLDPPVTVELFLSEEEKEKIYQKMVEIDFFKYPEKFVISVPPGELMGVVTPYSSYYFRVEHDSRMKELRWDDEITNSDEKADRLRAIITLIIDIIESKEEYKQLPPPRGGYL